MEGGELGEEQEERGGEGEEGKGEEEVVVVVAYPLAGAIWSDVLQVESLRKVEVALDCAALPLSSKRVSDLEVNLGAVECSSTLVHRVAPSLPLQRLGECAGREIPDVIRADGLFGSGAQVDLIIGEAKLRQHTLREIKNLEDLVLNLLSYQNMWDHCSPLLLPSLSALPPSRFTCSCACLILLSPGREGRRRGHHPA